MRNNQRKTLHHSVTPVVYNTCYGLYRVRASVAHTVCTLRMFCERNHRWAKSNLLHGAPARIVVGCSVAPCAARSKMPMWFSATLAETHAMVKRQPLTIANRASRRRAHLPRAPKDARSKHLFMARAPLWPYCVGGTKQRKKHCEQCKTYLVVNGTARGPMRGDVGQGERVWELDAQRAQNESARPRRAGRPAAIETPMQRQHPCPNALLRRSGPFFRISAQVSTILARAQASSRRSGSFCHGQVAHRLPTAWVP